MYNGQLEMSFNQDRATEISQLQRRLSRAKWWFSRMRQVVDRAVRPAPPPPPEQIWFRCE